MGKVRHENQTASLGFARADKGEPDALQRNITGI